MSVSRGHLPPTRGGSSKPFWACFPPLRAGRECHVTYELARTALIDVLSIGRRRRAQKLVWLATASWPQLFHLVQSAAATRAACAAREMLRSGEAFQDEDYHVCVCVCELVSVCSLPNLQGWGLG